MAAGLVAAGLTAAAAQPPPLSDEADWLRASAVAQFATQLSPGPGLHDVTLSNGLVSRTWTMLPGGAVGTTEYSLHSSSTSFIRGMGPEARVTLDADTTPTDVGGLMGQGMYLLYRAEDVTLTPNPLAMGLLSYTSSPPVAQYDFLPRWGVTNASWPPRGVHVAFEYGPPPAGTGTGFVQLNTTRIDCDASGCLTGWPTCDNSSVSGQCSWSRATAAGECAAWPACAAVSCNDGRSDCQARGSLGLVTSTSGFTSFVRAGWFRYPDLRVTVHYEMYDGLPGLAKWVTVRMAPGSSAPGPAISAASVEVLHVPWELRNRLHAETDYMPGVGERNSWEAAGYYPQDGTNFTGMTDSRWNMWQYDVDVMGPWGPDDSLNYWYDSGVNETLLNARYPFGPAINITTTPLETFRVYELLHDSDDLDRQGMARKRLLRTAAPPVQVDVGPAMITGGDSASIRAAADAGAIAGLRLLDTRVDPFNRDPAYIARVASDVAYVHSKGLLVSFYVLLQNPPNLTPSEEAIDPATGQGLGIACFSTAFHDDFRAGLVAFVQATGFDFIGTDGPYEAAPCASTSHEHHHGLADSQMSQWRDNVAWYRTLPNMSNPLSLLGSGIGITAPDPYELSSGTVSQPLGYTDRWGSLSDRWEWLIVGRTYAYDGTLWKPPTNALMPLDLNRAGPMESGDDLNWYDNALSVFLGVAGRFFQYGSLWQNDASKALVQGWAATMDKYRDIINADIVHVRKPTGRSWDAIMHVDPRAPPGAPRGFVIYWNPLRTAAINVSAALSVYYCGFPAGTTVQATWKDGTRQALPQSPVFTLPISRSLPPQSYDWAVLQ